MSNFIPPNIIQTPDFAGLAKERIDRKRQEETNKNAFLDQFSEAQGLYLDGDRPAVQDAWNKVQSTIDMVAENDTPESRRQLKQVYADYAKVAGTAQVLADQHRTQVASYKADPTKYAMSGGDFFSWDEQFRTKTRSFDDMQSALDNPNVLPSSASYALLNPFEQAQTLMGETARVASTFYDSSGSLDTLGLRNRVRDIAIKKIMANPEAMERAIIWGATTNNNPKSGFAGDGDGKINSLEELNMIKELPQDQREEYMEAYLDALVDDYMELTPGNVNKQSDKKSLPTTPLSIQAAGGQEVGFITLPGYINTSFDYEKTDEISGETTQVQGEGKITQIGSAPDGSLYVTIESVESTGEIDNEGNAITRTVVRHQPATQYQVDKILGKYGNGYDLSGLTPPPPVEQAATETEATPAESPAETTTTGTTGTTAVTIDPKDDVFNIFTDEATEEPTIENDVEGTLEPEETPEGATKKVEVKTPEAFIKIENQADETLDRISRGISAKELEEDKPYMFKEAKKLQKDIVDTRAQIKKGKKAGEDTTDLEEKLKEQSRILKKVNKVNQTISERRGRREFEESLPDLKMDEDPLNEDVKEPTEKPAETATEEAPAEETKEQPVEETKNRDYIVMENGVVVFRDEYDSKFAGKPSSTGTPFPDTFEEYAEIFQQTIKNEAEDPVNIVAGVDRTTGVKTNKSKETTEKASAGVAPPADSPAPELDMSDMLLPQSFYKETLDSEGGLAYSPKDRAARKAENKDAPKVTQAMIDNGMFGDKKPKIGQLIHTNKGVTYSTFKSWAEDNNIPKEEYQERFLNLTEREALSVVDKFAEKSGADQFESKILRSMFTQNVWGTGKVFAADFKSGRSKKYRSLLDWLQEGTGREFEDSRKLSAEDVKAIEDFYNENPEKFINEFIDKKQIYFTTLDEFDEFGDGWSGRAEKLRVAMLDELKSNNNSSYAVI